MKDKLNTEGERDIQQEIAELPEELQELVETIASDALEGISYSRVYVVQILEAEKRYNEDSIDKTMQILSKIGAFWEAANE